MRKRDNVVTGERGKGVGEEPNQTTAKKPGPLQIIRLKKTIIKSGYRFGSKFIRLSPLSLYGRKLFHHDDRLIRDTTWPQRLQMYEFSCVSSAAKTAA